MYPYGLIGNCQVSALVHERGSVDWLCMPRPDSPPVFGKILDVEGGDFCIRPKGEFESSQAYLANTNILVTEFRAVDGVFRITDFCPRFESSGGMYRPNAIVRMVEAVQGTPQIQVRCQPVAGWSKEPVQFARDNQKISWPLGGESLRLVSNMPFIHLNEDSSFHLIEPLYFALTWGFEIQEDPSRLCREFLEKTSSYWHTWVKHCSIPSEYQAESIRSALALKLHCYEETGAILAAVTTSLPEEVGGTRNWDYRFCWLRDSYFVLTAFHHLGHFEEMEGFVKFLLAIVKKSKTLAPVYRVDGTLPLPENSHLQWQGFGGSSPVRSNNEAATHVQNDTYGEMILALAPIFFDDRFRHLRTLEHEQLLQDLAFQCAETISQPDAGLWELRNGWQDHSFTNLMCWAGLDRIASLQKRGFFKGIGFDVGAAREKAAVAVRSAVREGSVRNGVTDASFNAALLQLSVLRFEDKALCAQTGKAAYEALRYAVEGPGQNFLYRYKREDDFGVPHSAFLFCSFWWIQHLVRQGEIKQAKQVLDEVVRSANGVGLFSEHFEPCDKVQLGNFPQAYSHVGVLLAAFGVSRPWSEVL